MGTWFWSCPSQASAEHLEDQLKGLLDDVGSDKALGTEAHRPKKEESRQGEEPTRKRRKMNSKVLEELNDGYDEVLVVDEANEPEEEMGAGQDGVQDSGKRYPGFLIEWIFYWIESRKN